MKFVIPTIQKRVAVSDIFPRMQCMRYPPEIAIDRTSGNLLAHSCVRSALVDFEDAGVDAARGVRRDGSIQIRAGVGEDVFEQGMGVEQPCSVSISSLTQPSRWQTLTNVCARMRCRQILEHQLGDIVASRYEFVHRGTPCGRVTGRGPVAVRIRVSGIQDGFLQRNHLWHKIGECSCDESGPSRWTDILEQEVSGAALV